MKILWRRTGVKKETIFLWTVSSLFQPENCCVQADFERA